MESQRLLGAMNTTISEHGSSEGEEWSEGSSYSSYYSDSDSTIPDWEPYVDDFTGELLYIECHPFVVQNNKEVKMKEPVAPFCKSQLRRSTRGKFLRLIRRRESKRKSKKTHKPLEIFEATTSKVKFQDSQEGEEKEVMLEVDAENRHNLCSDKSLAESLLGLIVDTLSDGNRVMIAGFSYDSKAKTERNIKIGDWLKSINNIEVNVQNLDDILQKFINRDDVLLKLQRVAGVEVTKDPPINELNNESNFVKELLNSEFRYADEKHLMQALCKHPIGIIYIDIEKLNENNQDNEDITYCFPRPIKKNILANSRGMYITLNHLLNEITCTKPRITSIKFKGEIAHIAYTDFDTNLLLFMLPGCKASREEILLINKELLRFLEFTYGSIDNCFDTDKNLIQIDHFFSRFFARVLGGGVWTTAKQFFELEGITNTSSEASQFYFGEVMPVAPTLILPEEAQMQIDDALTELEASDYREWLHNIMTKLQTDLSTVFGDVILMMIHENFKIDNNTMGLFSLKQLYLYLSVPEMSFHQKTSYATDFRNESFNGGLEHMFWVMSQFRNHHRNHNNEEPLDCQRIFTILGSALYHSGYLLASHFIHDDLIDVNIFCKQQGLFHLSRTEPVKSLVIWREIFPSSCRQQNLNVKIPEGKRYLLIVGCAKDLLVVIMEAGGCTEQPESNMGPDAFYVEEAQATLAHIQELGLDELAERMISIETSSQMIVPISQNTKRKNDFINLSFSKTTISTIKDDTSSPKKSEVTSILKRRNSDQNFIQQCSSSNSLQDDSFDGQSEGSGSQGGYSERSEISDDSRRNFRKVKYDSNEDDSETDEYVEGSSQISVSSFDVSEIRQSLLSETEAYKPKLLTDGCKNVLIHYLQLDITEGILLCPPNCTTSSQTYQIIINNFRGCCLQIHNLFQNTLRFKNMPTQDMAKSVMNKSLVAIKEHGMLFTCPYVEEKVKRAKISYWVVGSAPLGKGAVYDINQMLSNVYS